MKRLISPVRVHVKEEPAKKNHNSYNFSRVVLKFWSVIEDISGNIWDFFQIFLTNGKISFSFSNRMLRVEAEDRSDHDEYFSPSDIYRAVLRNNAAKRDQQSSHGESI